MAARRDAEEDELRDPRWMRLGVRQRQRTALRAAEHKPSLDAEMAAQTLDVRD